jgi:hypothetical protein
MRSPLFLGVIPAPIAYNLQDCTMLRKIKSEFPVLMKEKFKRSLTIPRFHRQTTPSAVCGLRQALTGYFEGQVRV